MSIPDLKKNLTHYEGVLSTEVRVQITDLIIAVTAASLGKRTNVKKLCGVAIELLDNAQRYCSSGSVVFNWQLSGRQLMVRIENRATKKDALRMMEVVESVNRMTSKQVAEAFRAQLTNSTFGEKGGAGLGFLDITRKIDRPITAQVTPLSDEEYLCRNEVHIPFDR